MRDAGEDQKPISGCLRRKRKRHECVGKTYARAVVLPSSHSHAALRTERERDTISSDTRSSHEKPANHLSSRVYKDSAICLSRPRGPAAAAEPAASSGPIARACFVGHDAVQVQPRRAAHHLSCHRRRQEIAIMLSTNTHTHFLILDEAIHNSQLHSAMFIRSTTSRSA